MAEEPLREFDFIRWIREQAPADDLVEVGIGDDAAVVANRETASLVTTDMLVDGVHFDLAEHAIEDVGWKCLACGVSDVAAMGGRPSVAVMAAAAPATLGVERARGLVRGALACAAEFDVRLVGGDLTGTRGPLVVSVAMLGDTAGLPPVTRGGAQAGDAILVTGQLGGSRLGRHLRFRPRHPEGLILNQQFRPHAMIDVSDGLAIDLHHILDESGVGAILVAGQIPASDDARRAAQSSGRSPMDHALGDGEDYELLFTLGEADAARLLDEQPCDVSVTRIGTIVESGAVLLMPDGSTRLLEPVGWEHFR